MVGGDAFSVDRRVLVPLDPAEPATALSRELALFFDIATSGDSGPKQPSDFASIWHRDHLDETQLRERVRGLVRAARAVVGHDDAFPIVDVEERVGITVSALPAETQRAHAEAQGHAFAGGRYAEQQRAFKTGDRCVRLAIRENQVLGALAEHTLQHPGEFVPLQTVAERIYGNPEQVAPVLDTIDRLRDRIGDDDRVFPTIEVAGRAVRAHVESGPARRQACLARSIDIGGVLYDRQLGVVFRDGEASPLGDPLQKPLLDAVVAAGGKLSTQDLAARLDGDTVDDRQRVTLAARKLQTRLGSHVLEERNGRWWVRMATRPDDPAAVRSPFERSSLIGDVRKTLDAAVRLQAARGPVPGLSDVPQLQRERDLIGDLQARPLDPFASAAAATQAGERARTTVEVPFRLPDGIVGPGEHVADVTAIAAWAAAQHDRLRMARSVLRNGGLDPQVKVQPVPTNGLDLVREVTQTAKTTAVPYDRLLVRDALMSEVARTATWVNFRAGELAIERGVVARDLADTLDRTPVRFTSALGSRLVQATPALVRARQQQGDDGVRPVMDRIQEETRRHVQPWIATHRPGPPEGPAPVQSGPRPSPPGSPSAAAAKPIPGSPAAGPGELDLLAQPGSSDGPQLFHARGSTAADLDATAALVRQRTGSSDTAVAVTAKDPAVELEELVERVDSQRAVQRDAVAPRSLTPSA
jgi:hypothetical protein